MCHAIKMPDTILITELQNQLALMQAKLDALQEDKVEMQSRIDHLLAELKLSKSQKYGKKSEKAPRGTFNEAEQHKTTEPPKHHKKGKQTLAEHFEREEVEHTLTELTCQCCGEQPQPEQRKARIRRHQQNSVFTPETRERGEPHERERGDEHTSPSVG